ncbi:MAG: amino acid ABC transporter substrate-binding protein [Desulfobacterium sp.]|nr:amino acid ABC transporter substrate-binding protein [Desulfobacterium sp.]
MWYSCKRSQYFWKRIRLLFPALILLYGSLQAQPLKVVTSIDPPLVYYDEEEKLTGATVELIREVASRLKREISINLVPWKRALHLAKNGRSDAICCAGINEERLEYLYFPSINITAEENVFFVKKGRTIKIDANLKAVSDIKIGVMLGYIYGQLQKTIDNDQFKSVQRVPTIEQNIKMLLAERTDIFIGNKIVVLHILKKMGLYDKVDILKRPGTDEDWIITDWPVYLAFSKKALKDPSYMKKVSQIIKDLKEDGTYTSILNKYE